MTSKADKIAADIKESKTHESPNNKKQESPKASEKPEDPLIEVEPPLHPKNEETLKMVLSLHRRKRSKII